MPRIKLISWNIAKRVKKAWRMMAALADHRPDVVALQEVSLNSRETIRKCLTAEGFSYTTDSFELYPDLSGLADWRPKHALLIASRFPVRPLQPYAFDVPWPDRILSAEIDSPLGNKELHTTHIPNGTDFRWKKVETLEGLYWNR